MSSEPQDIDVGPTESLCLRVSAAALTRVTFQHPRSEQAMLALELKAGLIQEGQARRLYRIAQPFGGSSRLIRPASLLEHIPDFHFDSPRARADQDLRILIRPQDWPAVRQFCLEHFRWPDNPDLEVDPVRELAEEFTDTCIALSPGQYRLRPVGMLVENQPAATHNVHARGLPTVRIFNLFEAQLLDPGLVEQILAANRDLSEQALERRALEDLARGGRGRANTALAFEAAYLTDQYLALPPERRSETLPVNGFPLGGNVAAILEGVDQPRYERVVYPQQGNPL
jgi:hypothetical protein